MEKKLSKKQLAKGAKDWGKKFESFKKVEPKNQPIRKYILIEDVDETLTIHANGFNLIEAMGMLRLCEMDLVKRIK